MTAKTFTMVGCAVLTLALAVTSFAQPVTDGVVCYFPFEGDAQDHGPSGLHATVNGATLTTDQSGAIDGAYHFDGNDYISIPLNVDSPAGALSAWVYVDSYQTGYNQLNLVLSQLDNMQLGLGDSSMGADGNWVFRFRDDSGAMKNVVGPLVELDTWIHVAGVWSGDNMYLYLDGGFIGSLAASVAAPAQGNMVVGRHSHYYSQNYWFGKIDEVIIYDRALGIDEVALLAEPPTAGESRSWSEVKTMFR